MPRVSIIIPTYNRAAWLPRAIESAKVAGDDVEVIVVDNGSTDETAAICRTIAGIRYLRLDPNVRQARARNAGTKISTGEFLVFLDDDDQRLPNSLDAQINLLEDNPEMGFVYGPVLLGDVENCLPTGESSPAQLLTGDLFWRLLEGNFIHVPSVMAPRRLVEEAGLFDPEVVGAEDWLLLIRLAERHLVGAVDEPVAICRVFTRTSGQTSSNRFEMCKAAVRTLTRGLSLPRALEGTAAMRRKARQNCRDMLTMTLLTEVHADLEENMKSSAVKHFVEALRVNPKRALTLRTVKWFFFSPWEK